MLAEVLGEPQFDEIPDGPLAEETRLTHNAKKAGLLLTGLAYQKYLTTLEQQQGVLAGICDVMMEAFAMESVTLRARKLAESGKGAQAGEMCRVFVRDAMARIEITGRTVLAACSEGDSRRMNLGLWRRFTKYEPVDAIAARRRIAGKLLDVERYVV